MRRRWGRPTLSIAVLAGAVLVLHGAGHPLSPPTLRSPGRWTAWAAGQEPLVVAFSVARLVALVVACYLLGVTVLGAVARLAHAARVASVLDRVTVGPVRRMLAASLSVSVVTVGAATVARIPNARPAAAVATYDTGPSTSTTAPPTAPGAAEADAAATVTMHRLPDVPAAEPASPVPAGHWTVEPGQCFWSIAEAVLARARGTPPTEVETVAYWHRLIDANRAGLADPGNPDLVFPGQVLAVPAPAGQVAPLAVTG